MRLYHTIVSPYLAHLLNITTIPPVAAHESSSVRLAGPAAAAAGYLAVSVAVVAVDPAVAGTAAAAAGGTAPLWPRSGA